METKDSESMPCNFLTAAMNVEPQSRLTRERPDLWSRALTLATRTTGCLYLPKLPGPDGAVYACGGSYRSWESPSLKKGDKEYRGPYVRDAIWDGERWVREWGRRGPFPDGLEQFNPNTLEWEPLPAWVDPAIPPQSAQSAHVHVPEGAMEWLLHEVGHWLAATPEERQMPNYGARTELWGIGREREIQAWGFEEIVLAPWGPSRRFAPPQQRDGAAFLLGDPMPWWATAHAERAMRVERVDLAEWRALYGDWLAWAPGSWDSVQ